MRKIILGLLGAALLIIGFAGAASAADKVTICHAAGLDGTTKYVTLTIARPAAYGQAGHFYENGTPRAGHEDDYVGPCQATSTPTDTSEPTPTPTPTTTVEIVTPTPTTTAATPSASTPPAPAPDTPKADTPKADTPKVDTPKTPDKPKPDKPKADKPSPETPKADTPKTPDKPKADTPRDAPQLPKTGASAGTLAGIALLLILAGLAALTVGRRVG